MATPHGATPAGRAAMSPACQRPRRRSPTGRRPRHADDGAVSRDQGGQSRTACCSTAWAISTSCSSTTPRSPAAALGIVLTKRGKHHGEDIPMCGVPVERADDYLQRLIAARPSRRRLRADRGPGRGAGSAAASRWCAATSCAWSRPAPSPRSACSTPARANYLVGAGAAARADGECGLRRSPALDISTGDFAVVRDAGRAAWRPSSRGSSRARSSSPRRVHRRSRAARRCWREPRARRSRRVAARRASTAPARAPAEGAISASRRSTASAPSRAPRSPPPAPLSPMSSARRSAARPPLAPPRRAGRRRHVMAIDAGDPRQPRADAHALRASAAAACSPRSTAP